MAGTLLLALLVSQSDAGRGLRLFHDPGLGRAGVACSACHSTVADEEKEGDGLIRAGHSLAGAAKRPYWRGDDRKSAYKDLGQAIAPCAEVFMGAELSVTDRKYLTSYVGQLSGKPTPVTIAPGLEASKDYKRDKYAGGDATRGRASFYRACHACHPHGDQGIGPALFGMTSDVVAMWVREGNGLLRGKREKDGWSPFFGRDRLSDKEVADIGAFVGTLRAPGQ